ncbi:MAG: trypsin-like serine protease [Myxococcota bacterium]
MSSSLSSILPTALLSASLLLPACHLDTAEHGEWAELSQRNQGIVGGAPIEITAAPHQVALQTSSGLYYCGGSILGETWIVTAAHCVVGNNGVIPPASIAAGSNQRSQPAQTASVASVIPMPGYEDVTLGKDIALIELATPLQLDGVTTKAIKPVLPRDAEAGIDAPGVTAVTSGWGRLAENGAAADILQSVEVPIIPLEVADAAYAPELGYPLSPDQIAAAVDGGGKDACQGDSGGPLTVLDPTDGEPRLSGVVSWGFGCARAEYPGMYARVSSFVPFLDEHMGGPPVAVAGDDLTVAPGSTVQLTASGSYDQGFGEIVSYSWFQTAGTPVTLDSAAISDPSFTAPTGNESLEFELTVTDNLGNAAIDVVVVNLDSSAPADDPGSADPSGDDNTGNNTQEQGQGQEQEPMPLLAGCSTGSGTTGGLLGMLMMLGLFLVRRRGDA